MILAPSKFLNRFIRLDYSPIKRQSIWDSKTTKELVSHPLRSMWPKIHGVLIDSRVIFVIRSILMIMKVIKACIWAVFYEGLKNKEWWSRNAESGVAFRRSADDRRGYSLSTRRFTPSVIKWKRWLQNKVDLNDCGCGAPGVTMFVCCVIKSPLSSAVKKHLILTLTVILLALGSQYQYAKYRD